MGRFVGWGLIGLMVYHFFYPYIWKTDQVRYRVTVAIDTAKGLKTGSGVWGYSEAPRFGVPVYSIKWSYSPRLEGEAFPIMLDNGKLVYVAFGRRNISTEYGVEGIVARFQDGYAPFGALRKGGLGYPEYLKNEWDNARAKIDWTKAQKGKVVTLNCVPALHTNTSSDCPALVQVVQPPPTPAVRLLDVSRLDQEFGPGVRLRSMTLEVVSDPISHGIERWLPWLDSWIREQPISSPRTETDEIIATGLCRSDPTRL